MFKLVLYKEKVRPQSEITSHQKKNLNLLKKTGRKLALF